MKVFFLIPIFNELQNLNTLSSNLLSLKLGYDPVYVFSDDGSIDGSQEVIKNLFPKKSTVVLGDGKNYGPGHAFNTGFEWILEKSKDPKDIIVTLEADNTSDLGILKNMVRISEMGFDLTLASVYAQGGNFIQTSFFRMFLSVIANFVLRFAMNIKVLTLTSFYRVYRIEIVRKIKDKYETIIEEDGFISMVEILLKAIRTNAKIIEYPMELHFDKRVGKSKMKILKTGYGYFHFCLKTIFRR